MIPEKIHVRPNVLPRYYCCHCGSELRNDTMPQWKHCPICGLEIEWNMARDVWPQEAECEECGKPLVFIKDGKLEVAPSYVGSPYFCRECRIEMCSRRNCLDCKDGKYPNCQWAYLKRLASAMEVEL